MDAATRKTLYFGLIGLILAGSMIAVFQVKPIPLAILAKDGTLSIYFASAPSDIGSNQNIADSGPIYMASQVPPSGSGKPSANITSLTVTIDSIMIHVAGEGNDSWSQVSKVSMTLDLLKPTAVSMLIATSKVPAENITMVRLHVSSASATVKDSSTAEVVVKPVIVSSGRLEVPLGSDARVGAQMTTRITLDRPHIVVEGNGQIRLTPSLHVTVDGPS